MKSFDDFLKEFNQAESKATLKDIVKQPNPNDVESVVSIIVNCITLIDKRAEDRLRAYHKWLSKDS